MTDADDILARANKNQKNYRARLHARWLCIRCRRPLEPERAGVLLCASCAAHEYADHRKRYRKLKKRGLCVSCGKERACPGRTMCRACLTARSEWEYQKRMEKKHEHLPESQGEGALRTVREEADAGRRDDV